MNGPGHRARSLVGGVGAVLALGLLSPPVARAQSADVVVGVERTPNARTLTTSPNWVPITVTVVDRATQAPPTSDYNVVAYATVTSGIDFKLNEPEQVLPAWREAVTALGGVGP